MTPSLFEVLNPHAMCPVIIARPGVAGSRQCLQVCHGMPIDHLVGDGTGFVFPRMVWRVDRFNVATILKDDGQGAVAAFTIGR